MFTLTYEVWNALYVAHTSPLPFAQGAYPAKTRQHSGKERKRERERKRDSNSVVNNQSMRPSNNPEPKENTTSLKKCLASGE